MGYPFYILFALAPSFIWLIFYFRKDIHPEPKKIILKVFLLGMAAAILAAFAEIGVFKITSSFDSSAALTVANIFLGIAFVEEALKYLVVRTFALSHPEMDEPIDIMLYMVISALGFAAIENILILITPFGKPFDFPDTLTTSFSRFIGATFLHTLTSGALGFFIAKSFFAKKRKGFFIAGLAMVTVLHGFYNLAIMEAGGVWQNLSPLIIVLALLGFTTWAFANLKKTKSVCQIR